MALDFAKRWALVSAIALALTGMVGCGDDDPPANNPDSGVTADASTSEDAATTGDAAVLPSLVEIAAGNPDFSMLVAAATRAGLVTTLSTGEFTIFAPTNAAFTASGITMAMLEAMPVESLTGILTYHAVQGTVLSTDLEAGPVTSVAMLSLIVGTEGGAKLNGGNTVTGGANVVTADILARNGVVHVIDRVLLPPTVADLARYAGLTQLAGAVESAELDDDLAGTGPFTVFAPTNDAFDDLATVPEGEALANVLLYHVVGARVPAASVPAKASSLSQNQYDDNLTLLFSTTSGVRINGSATVVIADVFATNGVVHVIDEVLLPMNAVDAATAAGLTGLTGAVGEAADIDAETSVADALSAQAPYTIFAPTNAAFTAIEATIDTLTPAQIRDILLYHVLDTTVFVTPVLAADLPTATTELKTLNGANATLVPTTTPPTIEGADIVTTDIVVTNGVIHLIDAVILPPT
jgi:transforming growth factor-beta-induced protein